jgi:hypothetical protein
LEDAPGSVDIAQVVARAVPADVRHKAWDSLAVGKIGLVARKDSHTAVVEAVGERTDLAAVALVAAEGVELLLEAENTAQDVAVRLVAGLVESLGSLAHRS